MSAREVGRSGSGGRINAMERRARDGDCLVQGTAGEDEQMWMQRRESIHWTGDWMWRKGEGGVENNSGFGLEQPKGWCC